MNTESKKAFVEACDLLIEKTGISREEAAKQVNHFLGEMLESIENGILK